MMISTTTDQNSTICDRVKFLRESSFGGRGKTQMAEVTGIPYNTYLRYETSTEPPASAVWSICRATGADPGWLLSGQGEPFSKPDDPDIPTLAKQVADYLSSAAAEIVVAGPNDARVNPNLIALPLLAGEAALGIGREVVESPSDWAIAWKPDVPHPSHTACLRVVGDSMRGVIHDGSIVAVDYHPEVFDIERLDGQIVAAYWDDGITIKRLVKVSDTVIVLDPSNLDRSRHMPIRIDLDGLVDNPIRGQVVWGSTRFWD